MAAKRIIEAVKWQTGHHVPRGGRREIVKRDIMSRGKVNWEKCGGRRLWRTLRCFKRLLVSVLMVVWCNSLRWNLRLLKGFIEASKWQTGHHVPREGELRKTRR